ncbi:MULTISPECIES: class III extradiol ring-cleavage dioxygenase [Alphaproteobacteria]|uniref:DODA-type extradiol aromatic ring-opening family dioxygenase n=1 Tax=Alphaproteobacteria TaxID=28211 RepID=UPI0032639878
MGQILFIPHGGGPLPLLGDAGYASLASALRGFHGTISGSKAIILVTAHWEAELPCLSTAPRPEMLFDYYGFPEESYRFNYPALGATDLVEPVVAALNERGIGAERDETRGFDHGTFIPMMLMRPEADIPILQMSLLASLDPRQHLEMGRALAGLLDQDITLIGSGFSFHNIEALIGRNRIDLEEGYAKAKAFHAWMDEAICADDVTPDDRARRLMHWEEAPGARFCHPREEHLLPLHVCAGAAFEAGFNVEQIFNEPVKGYQTSGYRWS